MLDRRSCSSFFGSSPLMKVRRWTELHDENPDSGAVEASGADPARYGIDVKAAPRVARPERVSKELLCLIFAGQTGRTKRGKGKFNNLLHRADSAIGDTML